MSSPQPTPSPPPALVAQPRYTRGRCGRCGAAELRRSRPRTVLESLMRALTPLTPVRCPACGKRALRLRSEAEVERIGAPPTEAPKPAEPQPARPRPSRRRRRRLKRKTRQALSAMLLAVVLAVAAGWSIGSR